MKEKYVNQDETFADMISREMERFKDIISRDAARGYTKGTVDEYVRSQEYHAGIAESRHHSFI